MPTPARLLLALIVLLIAWLFLGCGKDDETPAEPGGPCGITVNSPAAEDELCVRNTYRGVWVSDYTSGWVDIELMDRGAPVYHIRDNVADRGAVEFTAGLGGGAPGDSFQVRVTDANDPACFDDSDYFSMYDPAQCSISFTNPAPGSALRLYQNDQFSIEWNSDGASRFVDIGLYIGIDEVEKIADNTLNDGQFTWDIVAHDCQPIQYNLRIFDSTVFNDLDSCDQQSNRFRIDFRAGDEYECSVMLTSPTPGEEWRRGEARHIIFTITNFVGDEVDIILMQNGADILIIENNYEYDTSNTYLWIVETGDITEQGLEYTIRIEDSISTCCGLVSRPFTITGIVPE